MVELFEQNIRTNERQSSKGNQLKWENDGIWYKADYTGYEGLSEYMISHLLEKSTLQEAEYVIYDTEQIQYKRNLYHGAKSHTFLKDDWQIVTLERLFKTVQNASLNSMLWRIENVENRLTFLVENVERLTGLQDFGIYMNKLLTVDTFFLNEDRHTHNIAVLMNGEGKFAYCPIFDNGAGLLSDTTMDYPMEEDVYALMQEVKAKTISTDFEEQLDVSEKLYGCNLHFHFTKQDVRNYLERAEEYPVRIRQRVEKIIFYQMNKYAYLF